MIEIEDEIDPLKRLSLQDMSYSRISTYDWCQLQYYYQYIMKVPSVYGPPAVLGNMIHKALELTLEDGEPINKVELLQNYRAAIVEYDPNGDIVPPALIAEGEQMLIDFIQDNPGPMSVFDKEMAFSFILGRARINGYIDLVSVSEKQVSIKDYKSGKRMITHKETPTNIQLGIYSLFMDYLFPDKDVHAELYYLRKGYIRGHTFTKEELSKIEAYILSRIEQILTQENFLPTPEETRCKWCSYAKDGTCPAGVKRLKKFG